MKNNAIAKLNESPSALLALSDYMVSRTLRDPHMQMKPVLHSFTKVECSQYKSVCIIPISYAFPQIRYIPCFSKMVNYKSRSHWPVSKNFNNFAVTLGCKVANAILVLLDTFLVIHHVLE